MIRRQLAIQIDHPIAAPSDFICNIHVACTERQPVLTEQLSLSQYVLATVNTDPVSHKPSRPRRLGALPGHLPVRDSATIDLLHPVEQSTNTADLPVARLPIRALGWL